MSSIERGLCSMEEYLTGRGEDQRIMASDLCIDSLYTFMVALKHPINGKAAAKYPAQIMGKQPNEAGLYVVDFNIPNDEQPDLRREGIFNRGLWQKYVSQSIRVLKVPVIEGYFREVRTGSDPEQQVPTAEEIQEGLDRLLGYAEEREEIFV